MIKIIPKFSFIAALLAAVLFLKGCNSQFVSMPSNHFPSDGPFIKFIEKNLGIDWYGIYLQQHKIGYLTSATWLEKRSDGLRYKTQMSGIIHMRSQDETDLIRVHTAAEFSAQPPYSMIRYADRMTHKEDVSYTEILKVDKEYEAKITQGGDTRTRRIGHFGYTLKDYTAVQWWITQSPKADASIMYRYLDLNKLKIEENTSRITGIYDAVVAGVNVTYYDVMTSSADGLEVSETYGGDGTPYRIVLGRRFEYRLEPQSLATKMDRPIDFFLKNTVPIDRPLGNSETVTFLKLILENKYGTLLKDAPYQSVTRTKGNNTLIIINPAGGHIEKATEEEIRTNLRATIDIPAKHPDIIRLGHNAVGKATTPDEKVRRLVTFVYQFIEDDYTANPLTTLDIIAKKKGDCSEHAKLFTAMARSQGIPCRIVGGLIYLGDELQEFGLHAWNEVVIDDVWVPVDPTWNQTLIDATHIRFPVNISEEWEVMASIPNMKLTVLHVANKK